MAATTARERYQRHPALGHFLLSALLYAGLLFNGADAQHVRRNWQAEHMRRSIPGSVAKRGPPGDSDEKVPLVVTNKCEATIWPGITTQAGTGPGTGGFELGQGKKREFKVSADWQGRVWGRTNCTVDGDSCSCETGDCFGKLNCESSVSRPSSCPVLDLYLYLQGRNPGDFGRIYFGWRNQRVPDLLRHFPCRWLQHPCWNQSYSIQEYHLHPTKSHQLRVHRNRRMAVRGD